MRQIQLLVLFVFMLSSTLLHSQIISISGGIRPNNLRGSHFGAKIEYPVKKRWSLALNYQMVKYSDIFALPSFTGTGFHKEYKQDKTIIPFKELNRGIPIQFRKLDWRPAIFNHSFSFMLGYSIMDNRNFRISIYLGPHLSFDRDYYHSFSVNPATLIITENSEPVSLPYFDYEIFRSWDIGPGVKVEVEYKLFENVAIGAMGIIQMDVISEGIDLSVGGILSYYFNE